ncbi:hypothetical protein BT96DRAFT_995754 [Gymnopus androsaceus JB14]|uniref:Uncharacterized protein n=1 Tax=Gymnopus androsaceus JB14 TaxID=1447944 RepID=A0A6A4HJ28_9AGAR|nr:hypothetical protein BT96DRAFT_995754 [Gymnopus androsaceus JB14]
MPTWALPENKSLHLTRLISLKLANLKSVVSRRLASSIIIYISASSLTLRIALSGDLVGLVSNEFVMESMEIYEILLLKIVPEGMRTSQRESDLLALWVVELADIWTS